MRPATVAELLDRAVARHPHTPAVIARSGTRTYAELHSDAEAAAGALWGLGVRPGDRIAACLPNDLDVIVAFHAAQRIGAVWTGIGEALTAVEQQELVDTCAPTVVLAGPQGKLDGPGLVDMKRWPELLRTATPAPAIHVDPSAPAGIAFSSGTTGRPKAIVHSQRNLLLPAAVLVATREWGPDLRKGDSLPFTILNMLVLSTLATTHAGACCIVMDRRDPGGIAEWIAREKITFWNGAPAQLFDLARRPELDLHSLTEIWSGGGDTPELLRTAYAATHGCSVTATYGLSEAPTVVAIDPITGEHREGASGQVLPHLSVSAYDDDGARLEPGATGQLGITAAASGAWAGQWRPALGIWSDGAIHPPEPGPMMTGDVGRVDADGWLTMVDRKKLMIVRGGANVSPAEVERVLLAHPSVASAVVFGVPDERLGERVGALVVPVGADLEPGSLARFCAERLARYKVPERWGQLSTLPTNAMGKVIRTDLVAALGASRAL